MRVRIAQLERENRLLRLEIKSSVKYVRHSRTKSVFDSQHTAENMQNRQFHANRPSVSPVGRTWTR